MATGGLVFFALAPFGGAIVDRLDRVKVVYMTDFINGITVLGGGVVILLGLSNEAIIITLFVMTVILGINGSLFNPAASSLPPHILEQDQLQQSSSLSQGMFALYGILGAVFGGILYSFLPIAVIFMFNGFSFIFSGVSETFIRVKTKFDDHKLSLLGTLQDIKEGVVYVFGLKPIFWLVAIASVLNFCTIPLIAIGFPYLFQEILEQDAYFLSMINISFPIGIIITSIILSTVAQKEKVSPLIFRGLWGMAFAMSFAIIAAHVLLDGSISFLIYMIVSCAALLIAGFFNGFINIPFNVAIMKVVDRDKLGRVSSTLSIISMGLSPIAIALGGLVIERFGMLYLAYAAGIAMFVVAILATANKHIRQI
jgi:MFS family permease